VFNGISMILVSLFFFQGFFNGFSNLETKIIEHGFFQPFNGFQLSMVFSIHFCFVHLCGFTRRNKCSTGDQQSLPSHCGVAAG